MPLMAPTLVGATFAHEPAIGDDADATADKENEPKLIIATTQTSTTEYREAFTILPCMCSGKPERPTKNSAQCTTLTVATH
jgi:hypothetical protein